MSALYKIPTLRKIGLHRAIYIGLPLGKIQTYRPTVTATRYQQRCLVVNLVHIYLVQSSVPASVQLSKSVQSRWSGRVSRDIFIRGARGALPPPLTFDNPKRSKIWYVACGTIIRRVGLAAAAKCESSAIGFRIFFKPFLDVLWDIWTSESRGVYRKVHNLGPLN